MRLLLIEDEVGLVEALSYLLGKSGFEVESATDGKTGYEKAIAGNYDSIILDRLLPVWDGIKVLETLREQGCETLILCLTAKDSWQDRVEGLDAGADDYIIKPFNGDELIARIHALCRRRDKKLLETGSMHAAGLTLNMKKSEVIIHNRAVNLSSKECLLLWLLMRNCGRALTREYIHEKTWGYNSNSQITSVDTYIHYLRRKLNTDSIKTVRGKGYMLQEETDK
jgi:Response regulators consisting of a CheY-like receiver domain and a winged-helix DNA-binding domain